MTRIRKLILIVLALVCLLAAVVVVAVRFLPETDLIRHNIEERLRAATGRPVSLGALKVSVSFPRLINLSVEGISVPSEDGKSFIAADRVILTPSLTSLLRREICIESLTVQGLRASIRRTRSKTEPAAGVHKPGLDKAAGSERGTAVVAPATTPGGSDSSGAPSVSTTAQVMKWSVHSVRITKSRLEWIDQDVAPGKEVTLLLKDVAASLNQRESGNAFSVHVTGTFASDAGKESPATLDGFIETNPERTELENVQLALRCGSLDFRSLQVYLPPQAGLVEYFDVASLRGEMKWTKGNPAQIGFQTELIARVPEAGQLNLQGDVILTEDFSALKTLRVGGESDNLPFSLLRKSISSELPLDSKKGTVKTSFQGEWKDAEIWKLHGSLTLENVVPTGKFKSIAKQARLWAQAKLEPEQLVLENVEISGPQRLASLSGSISRPFSENRVLDLKGEIALEPHWLKSFGVEFPRGLVMKGVVPVHGRVRGQAADLWVDLTGDVTAAAVEWLPYLEKVAGKKGSLTLNGKLPWAKHGESDPHAALRMGLSGARVRLGNQGPWFTGLGILFNSEVHFKGNRVDFKDAALTLRRESDGGSIATAKADLLDLGTASGRINGSSTVLFDRTIVALTGLEKASGLAIAGSSSVKANFNGSPSALNWSMEVPLTNLDVTLGQTFRKPGGVTGTLTAEGKLEHEELLLSKGRLSLPGVTLTGHGKLRDQNGNFKGLTLELKRSELKELSRLFPVAAALGLSGPVDASVRLKPTETGVVPSSTLNIVAVDCHPKNGDWSFDKVKGTVVTEGASVEIPELAGSVLGSVEAPVKVRGSLSNVTSVETLNGRLSIEVGHGSIRADRLRKLLNQAHLLAGTLLNPREDHKKVDFMEFQSITGNVQIKGGTAQTENLKLKGADLNLGAIGSLRLNTMDLDLLAGVKTYAIPTAGLGKVPVVRDLIKKHEDLLKITGLDKELKRLGIDTTDSKDPEAGGPPSPKSAVTVLAKVRGPAGSLRVSPVLEASLSPDLASRLKALLN